MNIRFRERKNQKMQYNIKKTNETKTEDANDDIN